MFENLRADLARAVACQAGGRAKRIALTLATPGLHAILVYRFGRWILDLPRVLRLPLNIVYQLLYFAVRVSWGIELPRTARIGPGLYIGHSGGITISGKVTIGANCAISQEVTIGVTGDGQRLGIPAIGDDVYIAPGAKLFGRIRIGNNVKIGPNACVGKDIPDNAVVALDPGFVILSYEGNRRAAEATPLDKRRSASTG